MSVHWPFTIPEDFKMLLSVRFSIFADGVIRNYKTNSFHQNWLVLGNCWNIKSPFSAEAENYDNKLFAVKKRLDNLFIEKDSIKIHPI